MIGVVCDDVTADVVYDGVIAKGGDGDISWLQGREMTVSQLQWRWTIELGLKTAQSVLVKNVKHVQALTSVSVFNTIFKTRSVKNKM